MVSSLVTVLAITFDRNSLENSGGSWKIMRDLNIPPGAWEIAKRTGVSW